MRAKQEAAATRDPVGGQEWGGEWPGEGEEGTSEPNRLRPRRTCSSPRVAVGTLPNPAGLRDLAGKRENVMV